MHSVVFLGHKINAQSIHKSDKHIEAVQDVSELSTVEELQLFLSDTMQHIYLEFITMKCTTL